MTSRSTEQELAHPDRKTIQSFFDAIHRQYDFLNSLLSFGLDRYWRKCLVQEAFIFHRHPEARKGRRIQTEILRHCSSSLPQDDGSRLSILDLGVGTGKSLEAFLKVYSFERAVGCDFSERMLVKAKSRLDSSCALVACDFHELPFRSEAFDVVTGSFILRSVQDLERFFSEVKRVLTKSGKAVFLELTRPANRFVYLLYQPYLRYYLPIVGKLVSSQEKAYQFLSCSVQTFLEPRALRLEMEHVGFLETTTKSLTFGAATVIEGRKAAGSVSSDREQKGRRSYEHRV